MTNLIINQAPFLRTSRDFPEDDHNMSIEMNKAYIDIANSVNQRTIGLFSVNKQVITGESWFFDKNQRQQSLRQLFVFDATTPIPHNINFLRISRFSRCFGMFTDNANWYGLICGTNVAIPGQISFYLDPTNIVFVIGGGAPALTTGNIVLEWISDK